MSNFDAQYFGKAAARHISRIRDVTAYDLNWGIHVPFRRTVIVDEVGHAATLEITVPSLYPTLASAYPQGFVKYSNGTLLSVNAGSMTGTSLIYRRAINLGSFIRSTDYAIPTTLVPVFLSKDAVRLHIYEPNPGPHSFAFEKYHRGLILTPTLDHPMTDTTPNILIISIADDGSYADGTISVPFGKVSALSSPALLYDLTLSNITISREVTHPGFGVETSQNSEGTDFLAVDNVWDGVVLTLTTNSVSSTAPTLTSGWRPSDVGKTVVIHSTSEGGGSIVLTEYVSASVMHGLMAQDIGFLGSSRIPSYTFASIIDWSMFDFRPAKTFTDEVGVGATLTMVSARNSLYLVTVTNGVGTLRPSCM